LSPQNFCGDNIMLNRRHLLAASLGTSATALLPRMAWAAADTDRRFIFILQRGAADGIGTLAPTGDPAYAAARGELASTDGTKLSSLFTLHPAMVESAKLFAQKQASFAHAIASGYRDRSHFDGQNVLESGANKPYGRDDGWMNRLLSLLPGGERKALAISTAIPLSMRGPAEVSSYAPSRLPDANAELMERVAMLYAEDAQLAPLWASATQTEMMAASSDANGGRGGTAAGKLIASLMNGPNGARIVMAESNGWDTHVRQQGRLNDLLKGVDETIAALRTFGGGLVGGGSIMADWPGLAQGQLHEGRDLKPTMRFETIVIGALSAHYGIDPERLKRTVFPDFA
jgi:uncharacterized protein (DUF1501 family)